MGGELNKIHQKFVSENKLKNMHTDCRRSTQTDSVNVLFLILRRYNTIEIGMDKFDSVCKAPSTDIEKVRIFIKETSHTMLPSESGQ